ncbi:uncharacterized protein [Lolium perenne]|uniref:uncharacterized protein n=1 Tax=Lolium perenne TaxID=4522 RepID=UPI0021EA9FB1|nr:uncharacterized protein LOC127306547 [Lolium perenne]
MHPGAVAVGAAGGAVMEVRAVARAGIILGLAMAAIALVAATINPSDFHAQIIKHAAPAPAPASGAQQCAATQAQVLDLRGLALDLVLIGVVQAVFALAADVAVAGSRRNLGGCLAVIAHFIGFINAWFLWDVVKGAAVVAVGHCAGEHLAYLVICFVLIAVSYAVLLGVSLAVTCCS